MTNFLRKIALPATIAFFCALIGLNAFVASKNIKAIQHCAALRLDASDARADVVAVQLDLQAIETGQRGYLLTGDPSYLAPYTQAKEKLPADFSALRSRLAAGSAEDRAAEADIEKLSQAKIEEADETIRLREKGYRHRAFLIVGSNRGKDLMDRARVLVGRLSDTQSKNVAQFDRQFSQDVARALGRSVLASAILLALTILALFAFHQQTNRIERTYARQKEQLRATSEKLARFTSTLGDDVYTSVTEMTTQAERLLNIDGGFLPRQGQQRAEWIHDASRHVERVVGDLLGTPTRDHVESRERAAADYPTSCTA